MKFAIRGSWFVMRDAWIKARASTFAALLLAFGANAAAVPDFMVVDLRSWKTARFFASAAELPGGGVGNALYKTDYAVLRKIPKKDWYVALVEPTAEQRARIGAKPDAAREEVIAKLRARTGLSFDLPEKALPGFAKFNPVVPAREAAETFSRRARKAAAGEKSLTWLSGKIGACYETTTAGAATEDPTALAKTLAAARVDYVVVTTAGGREATFARIKALHEAKLPVILRISARANASEKYSYESIGTRTKTITAWSRRLGKSVLGWWFDDAFREDGFADDLAIEFAKAARTGNSEAMVTFNPGRPFLCKAYGTTDFTTGDVRNPFTYTCFGPSVDGSQWHLVSSLGADASDDVRYEDAQWLDWIKNVLSAGGAVTLGVRNGDVGGLAAADGAQLVRLLKHVRKSGKVAARGKDAVALASGYVIRVNAETGDDDKGDGSALHPFKTLDRAAALVSDLQFARGFPKSGVTVEVTGTYYWPTGSGFTLGVSAGGPSPDRPVIWTASPAGAHFSGAYRLKAEDFKPVTDPAVVKRFRSKEVAQKVRVYDLKELGIGPFDGMPAQFKQWNGYELFANGKVQTIARYPDSGWLEIAEVIDSGTENRVKAGEGWHGPPQRNILRPGVFAWGKDPEPARWNVEKGVYLFGFWCHDWAVDTLRVASIDPVRRHIAFEGRHAYGIGSMNPGAKQPRRYYAYNMLEVLDAPGEWYVDRDERLLYYMPGPDGLGDVELSAQSKNPLVTISGAQNLVFRGFTFSHALTEPFRVRNCKNVTVDGVEVTWIARNGFTLSDCKDVTITNCVVGWTGDAGVNVWGCGDRYALKPANVRFTGCEFHHSGRTTRHGSCFSMGDVIGVTVDHCYIHDSPYIGLQYSGNDNVIEYNEIACVMMEGSDGGATYTGRRWDSQGNVLRYNYIHHLGAKGVAWERENGLPCDYAPVEDDVMVDGIYLDDCDSGDTATNNVFWKAGLAFLVGGGHDNKIRNNVIFDCDCALHLDTRGAEWSTFDYEIEPDVVTDSSMLVQILHFDYTKPPWSERYPYLVSIMTRDPRLPFGTEFSGNVAFGCKQFANFSKLARETLAKNPDCLGNKNFGKASASDISAFPQDRSSKERFALLNGNKQIETLEPGAALASDAFKRLCPDFPAIDFDAIGRPGAGKNAVQKNRSAKRR